MNAPAIIHKANELARTFDQLHGCRVPNGYLLAQATHPQEQMMWRLAEAAYDALRDTNVKDVLTDVDWPHGRIQNHHTLKSSPSETTCKTQRTTHKKAPRSL